MEAIRELQNKYRYALLATDIVDTPYKYIPGTIKELSGDINKIEEIIAQTNDAEVKKECVLLKRKLNTSKAQFEQKLAKIPNKNYMEESDEEWVDENMTT